MLEPQGVASFPGVEYVLDASMTMAHGISPSVARLTIVPQAAPPSEIGTLSFAFGDVRVDFVDAKVEQGSIERTTAGQICQLSIVDRRWRWRFGEISGTYNARRDDFTLRQGELGNADTQRTPQQLASLCLEAMGESQFDVSDLPDETRPLVEWDRAEPAQALAELCDRLGCRVVLQFDNRVAVRRVGVGAMLPEGGSLLHSATINLPERPDSIVVLGAPNRYQVDFPLEAVGLTGEDGQAADGLLPIDQLSYRPAGGWSTADLPYLHQVEAASRAIAKKSVFRYYRIKLPVVVPGYNGPNGNVVDRLEQILPIEDEQVELWNEDGQLVNRPATVFGVWHPHTFDPANSAPRLVPLEEQPPEETNHGVGLEYRRPFAIDVARGLVIFDEPVYRNVHASASGGSGFEVTIGPAELVLRAACNVRDPESLAIERYRRQRDIGENSAGTTRYLRRDEIVLVHKPRYSEDYSLVDIKTNTAEADQAADDYLDAAEAAYEASVPTIAEYAGLVAIELDGAIGQVGFRVGGTGATTTATRNNDAPRFGRSYRSMRRLERGRAADDRLKPRELALAIKTNPHVKSRPRP